MFPSQLTLFVLTFVMPLLPCMACAWQPGTHGFSRNAAPVSNLAVNNSDRNDVVAFWHAVHNASEGYEKRILWKGNYTGDNGRISPVFVEDVARRLNFFRALCGVPSTARLNTGSRVVIGPTDACRPPAAFTKSQAAQNAALMLVRNYNASNGSNPAISHNPARSLTGWSTSAWNAAAKGTDFSSARVRVTDSAGKPVSVTHVQANTSFGDPALVWTVGGSAAAKSVYRDLRFNVRIAGIRGQGGPIFYNYSVTLINPDRLTSSKLLQGPRKVRSDRGTRYLLTPPKGAEVLQVSSILKQSTLWIENAESGISRRVVENTAQNYPLSAKMAAYAGFGQISGSRSFHLTFPTAYDLITRGVPEQAFGLKREIIAKSNAKLPFTFRRGYMTVGSSLVMERSYDGGVSRRAPGRAIMGVSNTRHDATTSRISLRLRKSYKPCHIRFRHFAQPGAPIYTQDSSRGAPTGTFIVDIKTTNCCWLRPAKTVGLPKKAKSFVFNSRNAGAPFRKGNQWYIGLKTKPGGHWIPYGPWKVVKIAG